MKNLQDLMTLISEQIKKNEGRMVQYIFSIHTEYMWVSINDAYNYDLIEWDYDLLDYLKFYFRKDK